jgi:cytochrome c oxidase cbb3-type subunit 2
VKKLILFFVGITATFISAWLGLVAAPLIQIGGMTAFQNDDGLTIPPPPSGLAIRGRDVYAANGCVYCHSQQVRPEHAGSDIERGWGTRPSRPRDYIYEKRHSLGTMRTGPDLSNIGKRYAGDAGRAWHHRHLYDPQAVVKWSIMPPYSYLYKPQKIVGQPSASALKLEGKRAPKPGYEVVPTPEAEALVEYLLSLNQSYDLPEAKAEK